LERRDCSLADVLRRLTYGTTGLLQPNDHPLRSVLTDLGKDLRRRLDLETRLDTIDHGLHETVDMRKNAGFLLLETIDDALCHVDASLVQLTRGGCTKVRCFLVKRVGQLVKFADRTLAAFQNLVDERKSVNTLRQEIVVELVITTHGAQLLYSSG